MATVIEKVSTVSVTGQTTIPVEVRDALGVAAGDKVAYQIGPDAVTVRKAEMGDPTLEPFLELLAADIRQRPGALREVTSDLRDRLLRLTSETKVDRNERLVGDSGL